MAEPYVSPNVNANRAYIEGLLSQGRTPFRFRYMHGRQPGTQSTLVPLRFVNDNAIMGIDTATRTPRTYRLDRLETLSEDEPREEPYRVGDPAEIERGEEYRRKKRQERNSPPTDTSPAQPVPEKIHFRPDRSY